MGFESFFKKMYNGEKIYIKKCVFPALHHIICCCLLILIGWCVLMHHGAEAWWEVILLLRALWGRLVHIIVALKPQKSGCLKSASFKGDVFGAPHTAAWNVPPVVSDPTSNSRCCNVGVMWCRRACSRESELDSTRSCGLRRHRSGPPTFWLL